MSKRQERGAQTLNASIVDCRGTRKSSDDSSNPVGGELTRLENEVLCKDEGGDITKTLVQGILNGICTQSLSRECGDGVACSNSPTNSLSMVCEFQPSALIADSCHTDGIKPSLHAVTVVNASRPDESSRRL